MSRALGPETDERAIVSAWAAVVVWQGFRRLAALWWALAQRMTNWKIIVFKRSVLMALLYMAVHPSLGYIGMVEAFVAAHMWVMLKAAYIDALRLDKLVVLDDEGKGVRYIWPTKRRASRNGKQPLAQAAS